MTRKSKEELPREELEQEDGQQLPEREVMSIIAIDPDPVPIQPTDPAHDDLERFPERPDEQR